MTVLRTARCGLALLCLHFVWPVLADPSPPPAWDHDLELAADAGYVQLRWIAPSEDGEVDWHYQLEESADSAFDRSAVRMEGHATAFFISGLTDGIYHYRIRARARSDAAWSAWSPTVVLRVEHHSRRMAVGLMTLGGLVFIATAAFLIVHRNDEIESEAGGDA